MLLQVALLAVTTSLASIAPEVQDARHATATARAATRDGTEAQRVSEWRERLARDPFDRATLLELATIRTIQYERAQAESLYQRLIPSEPPDDAYAGYALIGLGALETRRGDFGRSIEALRRATAAFEALGDSLGRVEALVRLATSLERVEGFASAHATLDLAESLAPPRALEQRASICCRRATLLAQQGQASALEQAETGIALARRGERSAGLGVCLHAAASEYWRQGRVRDAISALGEAAEVFRELHDSETLAATLQWRGFMLRTSGQAGAARRDLLEAIRAAETTGNGSVVGWSLINLSLLSAWLDDLAVAAAHATRAASLFEQQGDQWGLAEARGVQAEMALRLGKLNEARDLCRAQIAWAEQSHVPETVANAQLTLTASWVAAAEWDRAEEALTRAREWAEGSNTGWAAPFRFADGVIAQGRGDLGRAAAAFEDARREYGQVGWGRYQAGAKWAEVAVAEGRIDDAERSLTTAAADLQQWRATLEDADLRRLAFQRHDVMTDVDLGVATVLSALARDGRVESAFRLAENRRARELVDQWIQARAVRDVADTTGVTALAQGAVAESISTAEVAAALPDERTALLEYVTGESGEPTTLFVVTRAGVRAFALAPIDTLRSQIDGYSSLLLQGAPSEALESSLGAALLGPVLGAEFANLSRLLLLPSGRLYQVPFDALRDAEGRRVAERFAVSFVPSATAFVDLRRRPSAKGPARLLALADALPPRIDAPEDVTEEEGEPPFVALPGARREVAHVARFAPESRTLVGAAATETFVRSGALDAFNVLHFATHARVDEHRLYRTAIALSPDAQEDGLLRAGDIEALHARPDLVVLSACESASGVLIVGEGVQGLTASFLAGGARSVVATGWPIDDERTVRFMDAFYGALAQGEPAGDALARAKRAMIAAGAATREWAAFTLVGDPSVTLELRQRPTAAFPFPLAGAGAAFAVVLVLLARSRRRRALAGARG